MKKYRSRHGSNRSTAFVLSVLFTLASLGSAAARTAPQPAVREALRDFDAARGIARAIGETATAATAIAAPTTTGVPMPLPAGAVALDSTYYDLQDMGSLGTRIVRRADGVLFVTYEDDDCENTGYGCPPDANAPNPFPLRVMALARRDANGVWTHLPRVEDVSIRGCCVTELFGGFGGLTLTPDGRAAVAQHMNEDGCDDRGAMYVQSTQEGASYRAYLSPITDPSYLFPQIVGRPSGSFLMLGEIPKAGAYDEVDQFRVSYLAAEGAPFVCPTGWQFGAWKTVIDPSNFRDGHPAFPCLASSSSGVVGVAVGDFGGNVFLIESSNGTFQAGTITITNLTNYSDASIVAHDSTSTQFRPYVNCHVAYNGNAPHVVWSELQARRIGGEIVYFDHRSRVRHWSPLTGLRTVKQVASGEADRFDDIDVDGVGPIAGFNTLSVDWPQVGFSLNGREVYVAWLRFDDDEIDTSADAGLPGIVTGVGYGDIAVSLSRDGGPWSTQQNVTATPTTDERFFSLASANENGSVDLLFQAAATDEAGVVVIGDRGSDGPFLLRRIAYLRATLDASAGLTESAHDATRLRLFVRAEPNPTAGSVRFELSADAFTQFDPRGAFAQDRASLRLLLSDVTGRAVRSLAITTTETSWDLLDEAGRSVPAGIYFARLVDRSGSDHGPPLATRLTVIR